MRNSSELMELVQQLRNQEKDRRERATQLLREVERQIELLHKEADKYSMQATETLEYAKIQENIERQEQDLLSAKRALTDRILNGSVDALRYENDSNVTKPLQLSPAVTITTKGEIVPVDHIENGNVTLNRQLYQRIEQVMGEPIPDEDEIRDICKGLIETGYVADISDDIEEQKKLLNTILERYHPAVIT